MRNYIAIIVLCLVIGFFAGRCTKKETTIDYVKLPPIIGSVDPGMGLIAEILPPHLTLITVCKTDTIIVESQLPPVVDTMASIKATAEDWNKTRRYSQTLLDEPKIGKLEYTAEVQYNRLTKFDYSFIPVQQQITTNRTRVFSPFARIGFDTFGNASLGGGLFINKFGFDVQYIRGQNTQAFGAGLYYRF